MSAFPVWKEVVIPAHEGSGDLLQKIESTGMHIEYWAKQLLSAPLAPRKTPVTFRVCRSSNKALGLATPLATIDATKRAGLSQGLQFLDGEEILALRLGYADQPREWMRIAMKTYVDEDDSWLDLAIVNDGSRKDLRTTWGFPENVYQSQHEWFWKLPE